MVDNKNPHIMESTVAKFIAVITVIAFYAYIALVTFYPFEHTINYEFVNLAMGWIGGVATAVITFYFGSSKSSSEKTDLISQIVNKSPTNNMFNENKKE